MAEKLPWFPFHVEDWLTHDKLRSCSSAARGLWIDMLCLMHKNDRRGYLQLSGKPVSATQLARMTGRTTDEVSQQLAELLNADVASVTEHGILYSRRMVQDEHKRQLCSAAGKRGGGNPTLKKTFKGSSKGSSKPPLKGAYDSDSDSSSSGVGGAGEGVPHGVPNGVPSGKGFRSSLPCDNPELTAIARRVVRHYQETVKPAHTERGGADAVIAQLQRGLIEQRLRHAAEGYAAWCREQGRQPKYRESVQSFYSEGTSDQYLDYTPPDPAEKARKHADQRQRERQARTPNGPTVGLGEVMNILHPKPGEKRETSA